MLLLTKMNIMKTQSKFNEVQIAASEKIYAVLNWSGKYFPNPEDVGPHPWGPIARQVDREMTLINLIGRFNPAIFDVIPRGGQFVKRAMSDLNPQPIPPRWLFAELFADKVIDHIKMVGTIVDATQNGGGAKVVDSMLKEVMDGICPDPPKIKIPKRGWPWPPDPDPDPRWSAIELITVAECFLNASVNGNYSDSFASAASQLADVAKERM